jgi:hypothetical protein
MELFVKVLMLLVTFIKMYLQVILNSKQKCVKMNVHVLAVNKAIMNKSSENGNSINNIKYMKM